MKYKLYTASREYHCCCGCDEVIVFKEEFHIIKGDFIKKNHLKSFLKLERKD